MGNFSRDPATRLADAVAKRYVGVRMQQGVPLLDADWNELEDLRKHEVQSLVHRFIGDGVPAGNDGFRVETLAGGGVGSIVLHALPTLNGHTAVGVVLASSTAAGPLGFLPGRISSSRSGSSPASLPGNAAEPFALADGLTLTVQANGQGPETVTFAAADFADITAATAAEVVNALNAGLARATTAAGVGNDFLIRAGGPDPAQPGRLLAGGREVLMDADVAYTSQPLYNNAGLAAAWGVPAIPPLTTPLADRTDTVYVDVWEREVNSAEDGGLIHPAVGVETAIRVKRQWAVRVAENAPDLNAIPRLPGHAYLGLARLRRTAAAGAGIPLLAVTDLRKRRLTLADLIVSPMLVRGPFGIDRVNSTLFGAMLRATSDVYAAVLNSHLFLDANFSTMTPAEGVRVLRAFQDVRHLAESALLEVSLERLDNTAALALMFRLYRVQRAFVDELTPLTAGNPGRAGTEAMLDALDGLLEGSVSTPGLRDGTDPAGTPELGAAYDAQIAINQEMGRRGGVLPSGTLNLSLVSGPVATITAPGSFSFVYSVQSALSVDETIELAMASDPGIFNFAFQGLAPDPAHPGNPARALLELPQGDTANVTVTMNVPGGTGPAPARLILNARSQRNPEINVANLEVLASVGQAVALPAPDLDLELSFPVLNVSTDVVPVGRLADGDQVEFQVDMLHDVPAGAAEEFRFTVSFIGNPTSFTVTNPAILSPFNLAKGVLEPASIVVAATGTAAEGQQSQMIIRLAKTASPPVYFRELIIRVVADLP
jgi:hypothetical protein